MTATRWLYLARHGDASETGGLTETGHEQAKLLAERLFEVPLAIVTHSPLQRAAETAAAVHAPSTEIWAAAGDYVPFVPDPVPPVLEGYTSQERADGARWAAEALDRFAKPVEGDIETHELVITHAFLVAWFVRDALGAPAERWMGLNSANCALTVIRYTPDRPPALVLFNDLSHLPPELRWTGFSSGLVPK